MARPLKSVARLSREASGEALKLPSTTTPFAWKARNPGCTPLRLLAKSTICVVTGGSSAVATAEASTSDTQATDFKRCLMSKCSCEAVLLRLPDCSAQIAICSYVHDFGA